MGRIVTLSIPGAPVPQPRHRSTRMGRQYLPAKHPIHAYKAAIRAAANRLTPTVAWWRVTIDAVFARPPSHLRADGTPRPSAPGFPGHGCGDTDNLAKAVLDALTGLAWVDDTHVVGLAVTKRWADPGGRAETVVQLERVVQPEEL